MSNQYLVDSPYSPFTIKNQFKAISNGKVYIGEVSKDPLNPSQQIQVYVVDETGSNVPVSQPIQLNAGGYLVYNGQVSKFITLEPYSMVALNNVNAEMWRVDDISKVDPDNITASNVRDTTNGGSVQDFIDAQYTTVTELATGKFIVGQHVRLADRAGAKFNVVAGGTPNGYDIIDAGNGNVAVLERYDVYLPEYFGASGLKSQDARPYINALKDRLRSDGGGKFSGMANGKYYVSLVKIGAEKVGINFDFDNVTWISGGVWGLADGQLDSSTVSESSLTFSFKRSDLSPLYNINLDNVVIDGNLTGQAGHFGNVTVFSQDALTLYNVKTGRANYRIYDYVDSASFIVAGSDYKIDAITDGNYKWLKDLSISSGSNSVVSSTGNFVASDIGKSMIVIGAGNFAGAGANNALLMAKIISIVSPTNALLDMNALTTASGAQGMFGSTDSGVYLSGDGTTGVTPPLPTPSYPDISGELPSRLSVNIIANNTFNGVHALRGLDSCEITLKGKNLVVGVDNTVNPNTDGYPKFNSIVNNILENIAYTPFFSEFNFNLTYNANKGINCWKGPIFAGLVDGVVTSNNFVGMFGATALGNNSGIEVTDATRNTISYGSSRNIFADNRIKGFWNGITSNAVNDSYDNNLISYTRNSDASVTGHYNLPSSGYKLDGTWVVANSAGLTAAPVAQIEGAKAKIFGRVGNYIYDSAKGWKAVGKNDGMVAISSAAITITHNLGAIPSNVIVTPTFNPAAAYSWWLDLGASDSNNMTIRFSQVMNGNLKWTAFV